MTASVTIRMYNPGFGDCFVVTVADGEAVWRMLVDCGVHSHGAAKVDGKSRRIAEVVGAVIGDLERDSGDGVARLDVVVATHRHADHISGFANDAWNRVEVREVWVPYVEDPDDDDAKALKGRLDAAAGDLDAIAAKAEKRHVAGSRSAALAMTHDFAMNFAVAGNAVATERLVHGTFKRDPKDVVVRYLPDRTPTSNSLETGIPGVRVEVLGPSRDPKYVRRMDPPSAVQWLNEADGEAEPHTARARIFDPMYCVSTDLFADPSYQGLLETKESLNLEDLVVDEAALLAAGSILERSVNNTSVFFVLDARGERFVFVGDSQQGAWDHVMEDPRSRALITGATFYKVGHHGSHNATPTTFVDEAVGEGATAMIPVGPVKRWVDSIPYGKILDALAAKHTRVIRADQPPPPDETLRVGPSGMWVEAVFAVPDLG